QDVVQVPPTMRIDEFINKILTNNHHASFPVVSEGRLHGFLLLEELKTIPSERWPSLEARQVMRPVDNSMFIDSTATIAQARKVLASSKHERAAVLDRNGFIVGYVSRQELGEKPIGAAAG